jgi:thiosulfate dehydrogenase [quinone] large subunit
MSKLQSVALWLLRVIMGWFYFYAGITKVMDAKFSSIGYIKSAQSAGWLYQWLSNPQILSVVDFLVKWGLTLLGVSLLLGLFVRLSAYLGMLLMFLLYLPILKFPMVGGRSYIVDEHIIYMAVLWVLVQFRSGHVGGMEKWFSNTQLCNKYPKLRSFLS